MKKTLSLLPLLVIFVFIGCKQKEKIKVEKFVGDATITEMDSGSVSVAAGILIMPPLDTATLTPISNMVYDSSFKATKAESIYEFVVGSGSTPALTIDLNGKMVITDSLEVIRTFLWFVKEQYNKVTIYPK